MARMYTVIYSSHIPEKKMDLKKKKKNTGMAAPIPKHFRKDWLKLEGASPN
jgi:hypothetical protein